MRVGEAKKKENIKYERNRDQKKRKHRKMNKTMLENPPLLLEKDHPSFDSQSNGIEET